MKIAIVYDSRTGTTRQAAAAMAQALGRNDHECELLPVQSADPNRVAEADLVCIGSWTTGLFVLMQRATDATAEFVRRLPDLGGKRAVVFCTYRIATGTMLQDMAASLRERQATVIGQFLTMGPFVAEYYSAPESHRSSSRRARRTSSVP